MATNIGPKIQVDGEAEYRKQINKIIQQAKTLGSEMKVVTAGFDSSTTAEERAAATSEVLTKQIDVQKQRVAALSHMLDESSAKYGENDTKTMKWQQAVNEATAELRKMENQLKDAPDDVEDLGDAMDDASDKTFSFGDALKAGGIIEGAKAIAGAVMDVVEQTREYRKIMASLEVSSAKAGYTAQQTAASYEQLFGVLGDEQTAATTVANLQALHLSQKDLTTLIDASVGAWATYGDSIPIDGLAEAVNETIKAGKVTGTFADVINWAGTNEDEFNAKLEEASSEAERTNIVMQELASQGLAETGKAWQENSQSLVDSNLAANEMSEVYTRIATEVEPHINAVKFAIADMAMRMMDAVEQGSPMIGIITGLTVGAAGLAIALNFGSIATATKTALVGLKTSVLAVNAAMAANPVGIVIAGLAGLTAAVVTLWHTNDDFREACLAAWEEIKAGARELGDKVEAGFDIVQEKAQAVGDFFKSNWQDLLLFLVNPFVGGFNLLYNNCDAFAEKVDGMKEKVVTTFERMKTGVSEKVEGVKTAIHDGIEGAVSYIKSLPDQARSWGSDMLDEFGAGVMSKINSIKRKVESVASTIRSYLHFTVPDKGPLADADQYGPDFMRLLADGIGDNVGLVRDAAARAAESMVIRPQETVPVHSDSSVHAAYGDINITINGAEGQNVNELADAVMDRMQTIIGMKEAAIYA